MRRSVYQGHLFVGGALLNESGMENHPLTPMTDANLVRVLSRQTDGTVGLVPFATVEQGADAIRDAMTALKEQGRRYAIVDAVTDAHLIAIGEAAERHALITGGSGVAMGLPENFRRAGMLPARGDAGGAADASPGHAAVLAGSCSRATLARSAWRASMCRCWNSIRWPRPDAAALAAPGARWAADKLGDDAGGDRRLRAAGQGRGACRQRLGRDAAGALVEHALARIAEGLVARGVRRLVVAGGETSGAVVHAAWRAQPAHRRGDRSRRAVDLCRRRRRAAAAGAEVRQFRRAATSS